MVSDKWDVEKLSKQLHDPAKERIDLDCDACVVLVDAIQFLARENKSEDEIVDVATELCIKLGIEDKLVCTQAVREFKVNPASRFRGASRVAKPSSRAGAY